MAISRENVRASCRLTVMHEICLGLRLQRSCRMRFFGWTAMQYVDKSRSILHPDCGFAPSAQNPMDIDEAYLKLKVMCAAARLPRYKYG